VQIHSSVDRVSSAADHVSNLQAPGTRERKDVDFNTFNAPVEVHDGGRSIKAQGSSGDGTPSLSKAIVYKALQGMVSNCSRERQSDAQSREVFPCLEGVGSGDSSHEEARDAVQRHNSRKEFGSSVRYHD
jgi:hypothetical protein